MTPEVLMATVVKVTTVGNSAGIVLPKEILSHLNVQKGDSLYVTKTSDGIHLVAYEEDFAAQMEVAREVMRENRDVLRKLAE
jgi:putative addiction module antidote